MKQLIHSAAVLALAVQANAAAGEMSGFRRALETVPAPLWHGEAVMATHRVMAYINLGAAEGLRAGREDHISMKAVLARLQHSEIEPFQSITFAGPIVKMADWWTFEDEVIVEAWQEKAGLALGEIEGVVGYGERPENSVVWQIDQPSTAESLFAHLPERGFEPVETGEATYPVLRLPAVDLADRGEEISNPWRMSSLPIFQTLVARRGADVMQTSEQEQVDAWMTPPEKSDAISFLPFAELALDGLEATLDEKTALLKATIYTPTIGVQDDLDVVMGSFDAAMEMETTIKALEERWEQREETGLPFYWLAVIADIETPGADRGAAMAFAYPDCALAEIAAARFVQRWQTAPLRYVYKGQTMAERAGGDISTSVVETEGVGCAMVVTVTKTPAATDDPRENLIYRFIDDSILQRDFIAGVIAG